jgi:hypothetical protein
MITKDEFWKVMAGYTAGIMPFPFIFYVLAVVLVAWLSRQPGRLPTLLMKGYLSLAFAWNAIVFYLLLGSGMAGGSHGNYIFATIFIVVSALFAIDGFRGRMHFAIPPSGFQRYVTHILLVLVFCYPILGMLYGHGADSLMLPGAFPCPTVALALLVLTTALPEVDRLAYGLLLFCAIPFTPFFQIARYGVYEDLILFISGLYALILLLVSRNPGANGRAERIAP